MVRVFQQLNKVYHLLKKKWKLHHCLTILIFIGIVLHLVNSIHNSFKLITKLESENGLIEDEINRKEELSKDYINKMMSLEMKLTTKKEQLEQLQEEGKKLEKESATTLIRFDKEKDPSSKEENEYNKLLNEYQTLKSKFHGVIELNIFYKEKFQKLENELNDIENQIALLNKEYSEL